MKKNKNNNVPCQNRALRMVPNALTLCNSLCGFAAILYTLTAYDSPKGVLQVYVISAIIILCAMIFDALDGYAARMLNATSAKGIQMDSLADMVTFGVAPATIIAIMTHVMSRGEPNNLDNLFIYIMCAIYVGCAALRLATYNVMAMEKSCEKSNFFHGLPSPGAAAGICSVVLVWPVYEGRLEALVDALPFYAAALGLLMVSPVPYLHVGKWLLGGFRKKFNLLVLIIIAVSLIWRGRLAIFVLINLYIFSGPILYFFSNVKPKFRKTV